MQSVTPRLHDTTGYQTGRTFNQLNNRLSIRLCLRLTTAVEQPAASCKQTFNWLTVRLFSRFDNRLNVSVHDTAGCLTGSVVKLVEQPVVQPAVQPVVQPVVQPFFDNRLHRANGFDTGAQSFRRAGW